MLDMPPDKTSKQVLKEINKAREDILRPPKDQNTCETGKDEDQAFSAFFKAPARALQDKRLATRPRTFIILCALCQFIGPTGYCYPKQARIARQLGMTQQGVSKHIRLLVDFGYVDKVRNEYKFRKKGHTSATWRILFDPSIDQEEGYQNTIQHDERFQEQEAEETMKKVNENNKKSELSTELSTGKAKRPKKSKKEGTNTTQLGCTDTQRNEVVQELTSRTIHFNIKGKDVCNLYAFLLDTIIGTRGEWRWDERQEQIAQGFIDKGLKIDDFSKRAKRTLHSCKKESKRPPYSLAFFTQGFKETEKKVESVEDIIKKVSNRKRMK